MYASQTLAPEAWPPELRPSDPSSLFPYLMASTFDGVVEISHDGAVNYLLFANGVVQNSYLAGMQGGSIVERVSRLFDEKRRVLHMSVRRWPTPAPIPVQAPTGLVQAYRDLATSLVLRLVAEGRDNAPAIAEQARQKLLPAHPALEGISFSGRAPRAVVADAAALTSGTAALINQLLWSTGEQDPERPAAMLRDLMHERRHLFQSAGLYEQIHWKLT
jgi:hypothetical protein